MSAIAFAASAGALLIQILYFPFIVLGAILQLLPNWKYLVGALLVTAFSYLVIAQYADVAVENAVDIMQCHVYPYYQTKTKTVFEAIQRFFNPVICWWDGFMVWPQIIGRRVIFPTLLDCGLLETIVSFGNFLSAFGQDWIVGHITTGAFFTESLDFTNMCDKWQVFWANWQGIWRCGCFSLADVFTELPVIPMMFTSSQIGDDQWWCWISNMMNGILVFFQEILRIASAWLYNHSGSRRPKLRAAFDRFCDASTCFFKSWENALQRTFDAFIPYELNWTDMLCMLDKITCIMIRIVGLLFEIIFHVDLVIQHFTNGDSTYWKQTVKEDYKEIINMLATASVFTPISVTLPDATVMEITHYALPSTDVARPDARPNPLYNYTSFAECTCQVFTRLLCDPTNNGTTCAQKYNGTLLETINFCCEQGTFSGAIVDFAAFLFEMTLHIDTFSNFVVFLDRQPFTTGIKDNLAGGFNCIFQLFLAVEDLGACIGNVLSEIVMFTLCMAEFLLRVFIGLLTLPYFGSKLPGLYNFLTEPGDGALNQALSFLDRVADASNPASLINCLCYLLNTGFRAQAAGCRAAVNVTALNATEFFLQNDTQCTPTGFIDPFTGIQQRAKWGITPLMRYEKSETRNTAKLDITGTIGRMQEKLDNIHHRAVTQEPLDTSGFTSCSTCFDLCCFPRKLVVLAAQTLKTMFRVLNAAFQSRFGAGSDYFTSSDFAVETTDLVANLISPITCLCNLILLVIPPIPGLDPCCFFTLAADLIGCAVQILVNVGNSVANDPQFVYINDRTMLERDFEILLGIAVALFDCVCDAIRVMFGVVFDAVNLNKNFDPCCLPQKYFNAIISAIKVLFKLILAFATLENPESQCYIYIRTTDRPNCSPNIDMIPFVRDVDGILDELLAPPAQDFLQGCSATVTVPPNQKVEGVATCICTMLQNLLSAVFDNGNQCPLNLCCVVYNGSTLILETSKFLFRVIASLWQNWTIEMVETQSFNVPAEFIEFFFCNEYENSTMDFLSTVNMYGSKCGRLEPAFVALEKFLVDCVCSENPLLAPALGDVVDNVLFWFLNMLTTQNNNFPVRLAWPRCFCSGGPNANGFIRPLGRVITVASRQVIVMIRNILNPTYWQPDGGSFINGASTWSAQLNDNVQDIQKTWIYRFLNPFANEFCEFVTNAGCLLSMIMGETCSRSRYNLLSSVTRYFLQVIIYASALVEGLSKIFSQQLPGGCVGDPNQNQGAAGQGLANDGSGYVNSCAANSAWQSFAVGLVDARAIGGILVSMSQFIIDILIGIGALGCTTICPHKADNRVFTTETIGGQTITFSIGRDDPNSFWYPLYFINKGTDCDCYEKTPFRTSNEFATSFEGCRLALGLPPGDPVCPNDADFCTYEEACRNNPGDPFLQSSTLHTFWFFGGPQDIYVKCQNSTIAGPTKVLYGDGGYTSGTLFQQYGSLTYGPDSQRALVYWIGGYTLGTDKRTGCLRTPDDSATSFPAYPDISSSVVLQQGTNFQYQADVERGRIQSFEGQNTWETSPATNFWAWMYDPTLNSFSTEGACRLVPRATGTITPVPPDILQKASRFGPGQTIITTTPSFAFTATPDIQPLCYRPRCNEMGLCKNDQLSKCNTAEAGPVLDGVIISALKYFYCQTLRLFPGVLADIIKALISILSFLWQIAPGIVKLVVNAAVSILVIIVDFSWSQLFVGLLVFVIDLFKDFVGIFTQATVNYSGNYYNRKTEEETKTQLTQTMMYLFGANTDGCIDDPIDCLCALPEINITCSNVTEPTVAEVLEGMMSIFDGTSECDAMIQSCGSMHPTAWTDVPYAERFQYMDCVSKRVQGERYSQSTNGTWPHDFFYRSDGWYKLYSNIVVDGPSYVRRKLRESHEEYQSRKRFVEENDFEEVKRYNGILYSRAAAAAKEHAKIMDKDSIAYEFIVHMDMLWFKYRTGWYHFLINRALDSYSTRGIRPILGGSYVEQMAEVHSSFNELVSDFGNATSHLVDAKTHLSSAAHHAYVSARNYFSPPPPKKEEPQKKKKEETKSEPFPYPFRKDFFNITVGKWRLQWPDIEVMPLKTNFGRLFSDIFKLVWTDRHAQNHAEVPKFVRNIFSHKKRSVIGNCRLLDGTIDETEKIVDFCLNNFVYNLPNESMRGIRTYLDKKKVRKGTQVEEFLGKRRLRVVYPEEKTRFLHDPRVYARATSPLALPRWNFVIQLICYVEQLFGITILQSSADFVTNFKDWISNPSIDPQDYPNVGGIYWLTFPFRCEFPENLSCMIGIGLKEAFKKVTIVYVVVVVVGFASGFLSFISVLLSPILYFLALAIVAYHYSPACLLLFPSFTLGAGISIPFLPVPLGAWALPMCLWDDFMMIIGELIRPCYDNIIPRSWLNNPEGVCVPCGMKIDVVNCAEIGLGDGISNALYLIYKWLGPGFTDIIVGIATSTFGRLFSGVDAYLMNLLNSFKTASALELERFDTCSIITGLSLSIVVFALVFLGIAFVAIIPAFFGIVVQAISLAWQTRAIQALIAQGEPTQYDRIPGEGLAEPAVDIDDEGPGIAGKVSRLLRRFVPKTKLE